MEWIKTSTYSVSNKWCFLSLASSLKPAFSRTLYKWGLTSKAYVNNFLKENYASDIHSQNSTFTKEELVEKNIENISVAGRVVLMRVMGNASFATIRDSSGDIQIYVSKNTVPLELYEDFKKNNPKKQ